MFTAVHYQISAPCMEVAASTFCKRVRHLRSASKQSLSSRLPRSHAMLAFRPWRYDATVGRPSFAHSSSLPASVKKNDISLDHKKSVFLRPFLPSERPIQAAFKRATCPCANLNVSGPREFPFAFNVYVLKCPSSPVLPLLEKCEFPLHIFGRNLVKLIYGCMQLDYAN